MPPNTFLSLSALSSSVVVDAVLAASLYRRKVLAGALHGQTIFRRVRIGRKGDGES